MTNLKEGDFLQKKVNWQLYCLLLCQKYIKEGINNLLQNKYHGYFGFLSSAQLSLLCSELKSKVYTTAKSVADWIHINFGVTSAGIVDLLNRIGFSYKINKRTTLFLLHTTHFNIN